MADCVYNGVYASLTISDGSTPSLSIKADAAVADVNVSNLGSGTLNEVSAVESRGRLLGLAPGARVYPEISFSVYQIDVLSHSEKETVQAFILGLAPFSARKSTSCEGGAATTLDVLYEIVTPDGVETIEAKDVHLRVDSFAEGDPNATWSVSGTVYGDVLINGVVAATEYKIPSGWGA